MRIPPMKRHGLPDSPASRWIALAVLASVACAEPTSPGAPAQDIAAAVEPAAVGPRTASIRRLSLDSKTIILDATPVPYTVTLRNPNRTEMTETFLQAEVIQGSSYRGAGGINVECGAGDAVLPAGNCTMEWLVATSHEGGGEGTMVPGPAELVVTLYQGFLNPVAQDAIRIRVTLANP
jgi:hypothetical protein